MKSPWSLQLVFDIDIEGVPRMEETDQQSKITITNPRRDGEGVERMVNEAERYCIEKERGNNLRTNLVFILR